MASSNVGNGKSVLGLCHDIENAYGFAVECLHRDEPNALFQTNLVVVLNRPLCRLTQNNPTNATFKFLAMRVVATVYHEERSDTDRLVQQVLSYCPQYNGSRRQELGTWQQRSTENLCLILWVNCRRPVRLSHNFHDKLPSPFFKQTPSKTNQSLSVNHASSTCSKPNRASR